MTLFLGGDTQNMKRGGMEAAFMAETIAIALLGVVLMCGKDPTRPLLELHAGGGHQEFSQLSCLYSLLARDFPSIALAIRHYTHFHEFPVITWFAYYTRPCSAWPLLPGLVPVLSGIVRHLPLLPGIPRY